MYKRISYTYLRGLEAHRLFFTVYRYEKGLSLYMSTLAADINCPEGRTDSYSKNQDVSP
jgi:hypothetical protein